MFGNKKNNLPPRPNPPLSEQILEDLRNADQTDIVFEFVSKDEQHKGDNLHFPINANDPEAVYYKVKRYLDVNRQLKELNEKMRKDSLSLRISDEEMKKLAQDIRKQAQEALIK